MYQLPVCHLTRMVNIIQTHNLDCEGMDFLIYQLQRHKHWGMKRSNLSPYKHSVPILGLIMSGLTDINLSRVKPEPHIFLIRPIR